MAHSIKHGSAIVLPLLKSLIAGTRTNPMIMTTTARKTPVRATTRSMGGNAMTGTTEKHPITRDLDVDNGLGKSSINTDNCTTCIINYRRLCKPVNHCSQEVFTA